MGCSRNRLAGNGADRRQVSRNNSPSPIPVTRVSYSTALRWALGLFHCVPIPEIFSPTSAASTKSAGSKAATETRFDDRGVRSAPPVQCLHRKVHQHDRVLGDDAHQHKNTYNQRGDDRKVGDEQRQDRACDRQWQGKQDGDRLQQAGEQHRQHHVNHHQAAAHGSKSFDQLRLQLRVWHHEPFDQHPQRGRLRRFRRYVRMLAGDPLN